MLELIRMLQIQGKVYALVVGIDQRISDTRMPALKKIWEFILVSLIIRAIFMQGNLVNTISIVINKGPDVQKKSIKDSY